MIPKVARAVARGERPAAAAGSGRGTENDRPLASSAVEIAQAGSNCSSTSARSVTTTNVPTSAIAARSISR